MSFWKKKKFFLVIFVQVYKIIFYIQKNFIQISMFDMEIEEQSTLAVSSAFLLIFLHQNYPLVLYEFIKHFIKSQNCVTEEKNYWKLA